MVGTYAFSLLQDSRLIFSETREDIRIRYRLFTKNSLFFPEARVILFHLLLLTTILQVHMLFVPIFFLLPGEWLFWFFLYLGLSPNSPLDRIAAAAYPKLVLPITRKICLLMPC